jgi:septal ring-binding cell division protein DamX
MKRTGHLTCAAQYSTSCASSAVTQRPVTLDRNRNAGARSRTPRTTSRQRSSIGSIIQEWEACEVSSLRCHTPFSLSTRSASPIASSLPESTDSSSALSAATLRPPPAPASRPASDSACSSPSATLSIAPPGSSCIRRPRAATSRSPSARV